jgi:septal ring factor EnvC (AmiA/AmiB activator)
MESNLTDLQRAEARIKVMSRQLRESQQRNSDLREDNDNLQERIAGLLAQVREPPKGGES